MLEHDYKKFPELTNRQIDEFGLLSPHEQITKDFEAVVVHVTDGDTVRLRVGWRSFDFPLRFLDIDAPEMNAGGEVARDWLKGKVLGREVMVLVDLNNRVDRYGRLLGRVMFGGSDLGQEELYLGLAVPFGSKLEGGVPELSKWL